MQHDAPAVALEKPLSARIPHVREAYAEYTRSGLEVMHGLIEELPTSSSNVGGHLAWDVSFCIRAACLAWQQTRDAWFLERAVDWAERICAGTDANIGLVDWRGRSGPTWSAGSRYTAGITTVGASEAGPIKLQAAAEAVRVDRPSPTTARLTAIRDRSIVWESPEGAVSPESEVYLPDLLSRGSSVHALLFRGMARPVDLSGMREGHYKLEPLYASHLVHTGLIARSLIYLAQTISGVDREVFRSSVGVQELLSVAQNAIDAHEDELVTANGKPWYVTPLDFPGRRLGMQLPHNHIADVATSLMLIGRENADAEMVARGKGLASRFIHELRDYRSPETVFPWNYYPVGSDSFTGVYRDAPVGERVVKPAPRSEDSSHATMRIRALMDWKELDGELVSDETVRIAATTFYDFFLARKDRGLTQRYMAGPSTPNQKFGISDSYIGAWGALAPWNSSLRRSVNAIASRNPPDAFFGATVLACAEVVQMNMS